MLKAEFVDQNDYNEITKNPWMRDICKSGTDLVWSVLEGTNQYIKVKYATNATDATVYTESTYDYSAYSYSFDSRVIKADGTTIRLAYHYANGSTDVIKYHEGTHKGSWATNYTLSSGGGKVIDIVYPYVIFQTGAAIKWWKVTDGTTGDIAASGVATEGAYGGYWDGTYYYGVYIDTSGDMIEFYTDFSSTTTETLDTDIPASKKTETQQYWIQGDSKFIVDYDHFYYKHKDMSGWAQFTRGTGSSSVCVIWDSDGDISWVYWSRTIWKVFKYGGIAKFQEFDEPMNVGFEDMLYNAYPINTVLNLESVDMDVYGMTITDNLLRENTANILLDSKPDTDMFYIFYDDSETLLFQGFAGSLTWDGSAYYSVSHYEAIKFDLGIKVYEEYDSKSSDYIFKDIIEKYCNFLTYGTVTSIADSNTIKFSGRRVIDIFKWIRKVSGKSVIFNPDYSADFGDFSASGITISEDDSLKSIPSYTEKNHKISMVELYGSWIGGKRLHAISMGEGNYGKVIDYFPEVMDLDSLQSLADQMVSDLEEVVINIDVSVGGKGRINVGQTVILDFPNKYSINSDTYYVQSATYDPINDITGISATSVNMLPQALEMNTQNNNEQYSDQKSSDNVFILGRNATEEDFDDVLSQIPSNGGTIIVNSMIELTSYHLLPAYTKIIGNSHAGGFYTTTYNSVLGLDTACQLDGLYVYSTWTSNNVILVKVSGHHCRINNCDLYGALDGSGNQKHYGIYTDVKNNLQLSNNYIHQCFMGVRINGGALASIDNNQFYDCQYGIGIYTSGSDFAYGTISNNIMISIDVNSIYIPGGDWIAITGNILNTNIYITGTPSQIGVVGNRVQSITGTVSANTGNWNS